jgi:hypothetical protein
MKKYYIVSTKHTSKADTALTLWGHNNAGYVYSKSRAGIYTEDQVKRFENDIENIPVDKEAADKLFLPADDYNDHFIALPNDTTVRTILNVSTKGMKPAKYKTCKMLFRLFKDGEKEVSGLIPSPENATDESTSN